MGNEDISVGILAIFIHRSNHEKIGKVLFIKIKFLEVHKNRLAQKPVCDDTDFLMLKRRVMGGVSTKKFLVFRCLYLLERGRTLSMVVLKLLQNTNKKVLPSSKV